MTRSPSVLAGTLFAIVGLAVAISPALAQDKPSALPAQAETLREPDLAAWREAYAKAGRPVIAVYCGWATDAHQAKSPEDTILNSDPSSLTMRLREALQLELDDPEAQPEFLDPNATRAALGRLQGTLDLRREREAAKMLGVEAGANLIILVSLTGDASGGMPTGGSLSVIDANRGRSAGRPIPFEWVYETDLVGIRSMAKRLAERLVEDLSARGGAARPTTVRLYGEAAGQTRALAALRRQLLAFEGVESVRPGQAVGGRREASRELTITTSLDPLDLELALAESLAEIGYDTEPMKAEGDALTLRTHYVGVPERAAAPITSTPAPAVEAARLPETPAAVPTPIASPAPTSPRQRALTREDCEIDLLDPDSLDGQMLRGELTSRYTSAGLPTVAVLINRAPLSGELQRAADRLHSGLAAGAGPEQVIVWQNTGQGGGGGGNVASLPGGTYSTAPTPIEIEEFQTINTLGIHSQTLESMLYERLGTGSLDSAGLGFRLVDGATVREKLRTLIAASASPLAEADVIKAIRDAKIADMVIVGRAAIEKNDGRTTALYDFRLVGPQDALLAQATGLSSALSVSTGLGSIEDLADIAAGRLGCGLLESWRRSTTPTGAAPR